MTVSVYVHVQCVMFMWSGDYNCTLCRGRAPIASMEGMEELEGLEGVGDILTGSNPGLATTTTTMATLQPDCHVLTPGTNPGRGLLPGLRYRHLGKSGLKVNIFWILSFRSFDGLLAFKAIKDIT